jgi:hypothetical protein
MSLQHLARGVRSSTNKQNKDKYLIPSPEHVAVHIIVDAMLSAENERFIVQDAGVTRRNSSGVNCFWIRTFQTKQNRLWCMMSGSGFIETVVLMIYKVMPTLSLWQQASRNFQTSITYVLSEHV